ncbi:MAG: DNA-binding protein [Candidatus Omnitrophota bacterium]|nr:MAG: DNA-binding protein [Candidatus Omnitrophota bacterium]
MLSERQAAEFLGFTIRALQSWRQKGNGPKFVKISARAIKYRRRDLVEWCEGKIRKSTSDSGGAGGDES